MLKVTALAASFAVSSAFVAQPSLSPRALRRHATDVPSHESTDVTAAALLEDPVVDPAAAEAPPLVNEYGPTLNGWSPDFYSPCYGLPGAVAPTGFFDPLGFAQRGTPFNDVKRNRESEVMHGRVAMLAAVGYLVGETTGGPFSLSGPANDQLAQVPTVPFALLTLLIGVAETYRATVGWVEPSGSSLWTLRKTYYPGDLGFDPLGLKPEGAADFARMQTKELQNGRLAMLGVAGMCAQELCNHKTILETYEFYSKFYAGVDPYA